MKPKYLLMTILAGLLQTVGWTALDTGEQKVDYDGYDTYQVISQCNVFSKDRFSPPEADPDTSNSTTITVDKVIASYVLKGVAVNGPQIMAFVEDVVSGEFLQVTTGTQLPNGTIKGIQHNRIIYEEHGESQSVDIGDNFSETVIQIEVPVESP